jgi:class 3 adenylate cyclase/tetratricopeptide (TPR) repeat protein
MECLRCGGENPTTNRFCGSCGLSLALSCASCGEELPPGQRFCGTCGTPTAAGAAVTAGPEAASGTVQADASSRDPAGFSAAAGSDAERRLVSVLFVDLVGFTTFSEQRDPEVVRELQSAYFEQARTIVDRYGGVTEKFIGDAVMAVWGTPVAREDDAERAVRAALDLVDAVEALGEAEGGAGLQARAGIVTGEAAVRLAAVGQGMVAGDVVNTASRVQSAADPGSVLVDDATRAASSGAISYAAAGEHLLKGRSEPARLFSAEEVVAGSGGAQRFDGLEAPFRGRDRELRALKELFHETAERSRARLVVVSADAGVGKSRLGWEFFKYLDGIELTMLWHVGRCLSYGEGVAYWALAEMIRMRLRISEGDSEDVVVARLDDGLLQYVDDADERAWLRPRLAVLLGVGEVAGREAVELERDSLFAGWRRFIERLADHDPVVLLFEDAQAADVGLLDFIDHLLEWTAERPIFVIVMARPELRQTRPDWSGHQRSLTVQHLDPLPNEVIERILDGLVGGLPPSTRQALAARAEGNPLFAIETVRMLIDRDVVVPHEGRYVLASGLDDVGDLDVPPTLQALVAARLDNLPEAERHLVMDAAVLGRSFTPSALRALVRDVGGIDPAAVDALLASLARREVLTIRGDARSPEAGQYRFEQKVTRTVAYGTLSRRDRKQRHLAAAAHLEVTHDVDDIAGVIASHYLEAAAAVPDDDDSASLRSIAARHLERAGERARALAAADEARRYFERALELAADDVDRARLAELAGLMAYRGGDPLHALERYRLARDLHRAADRRGDVARVASREGDALADLDRSAEALDLMLAVHEDLGGEVLDEGTAMLANSIATALFSGGGDPGRADEWLERASETAEAVGAWEILARALNVRGIVLTTSGRRPLEGRALLRAALDLAVEQDLPYRATIQSGNLAEQFAVRDLAAAERYGLDAVAAAERVGDRFTTTFAQGTLATVRLFAGRWDAIDQQLLRTQLAGLVGGSRFGHLVPLVALGVWRGDGSVLDLHDNEPPTDDPFGREYQLAVEALLDVHRGELEAVVDRGDELLRLWETIGLETCAIAWSTTVLAAFDLGRTEDARRIADAVGTAPSGLLPPLVAALYRWFAARLAALDGDHDRARVGFEAATTGLRDLGTRFWYARALLDQARWLVDRGHVRPATELTRKAHAVLVELEAAPFVRQAAGLLDRVAAEPIGVDPTGVGSSGAG